MKNTHSRVRTAILVAIITILIVVGCIYCYNNCDAFRAQFLGNSPSAIGEVTPESRASLAARSEFFGMISFILFLIVIVLQLIALGTAQWIANGIRMSTDSPELKIQILADSDIFFDLPLYFGLLGTVASFMVMTFSPGGLLMAYSSTLVGIIFSTFLRVFIVYPLRRNLLKNSAN